MLSQNFKIENSIYPEKTIIQAIFDFSEIATITYADSVLCIEAEWWIDEIFNEFMNYVLSISNESSID